MKGFLVRVSKEKQQGLYDHAIVCLYQIILKMHLRKYLTCKCDKIFQNLAQTSEDASPEFPMS